MSSQRNLVVFSPFVFSAAAFAQATYQPVALSTQLAPGTLPGITFASFGNRPVLNGAGQACFMGNLLGIGVSGTNNSGLWGGPPGQISLYAREGEQAPGVEAGAVFSGFYDPLFNASGVVAFPGTLRNVSTSVDYGVWIGSPGQLTLAAREGYPAPGSSGVFGGISSLVLNAQGQIAFYATLSGSGITFSNDTGIWMGYATNLTAIAREGSPAPGVGAPFGSFYGPVLNDSGQIAFRAAMTSAGTGDLGLWSGTPGNLSLIVRKSTQAPQLESGVNIEVPGDPGINNSGQLALITTLSGAVNSTNDKVIYRVSGGSFEVMARKGQAVPGTSGAVFADLTDAVINHAGTVAFRAVLSGPGIGTGNDESYWCGVPGNVHLVAREGSPAPGTSASFLAFTTPQTLTASNGSAFVATLTGSGVGSSNDTGVWATDSAGALSLLVRKGDAIQIGLGDVRTVSTLNLIYSLNGGEDGRITNCNSSGQVAFHAGFVGSTQGIFLGRPGTAAPPASRSIVQWRSVRSHAGTALSIPLKPSATGSGTDGPTVEPRDGGIQRIDVVFDGPVTLALPAGIFLTGQTSVDGVLGSPVTYLPSSVSLIDSTTLSLLFNPGALPDRTCYTVQLGLGTLLETLTGPTSVKIRSLQGDVTMSGDVTLSDAMLVRTNIGQPISAAPQYDLNLSGGNVTQEDAVDAKLVVGSKSSVALCP